MTRSIKFAQSKVSRTSLRDSGLYSRKFILTNTFKIFFCGIMNQSDYVAYGVDGYYSSANANQFRLWKQICVVNLYGIKCKSDGMLKLNDDQRSFSPRDSSQNLFDEIEIILILSPNPIYDFVIALVQFFGQIWESTADITTTTLRAKRTDVELSQ